MGEYPGHGLRHFHFDELAALLLRLEEFQQFRSEIYKTTIFVLGASGI
ncbi:MAG TPA: hypothetical protein VMD08_10800 [Candidatus Baltobacteraceae bacterium]|nr:hypothetical protein [Candidatus Baltobacteraceae bacterium]